MDNKERAEQIVEIAYGKSGLNGTYSIVEFRNAVCPDIEAKLRELEAEAHASGRAAGLTEAADIVNANPIYGRTDIGDAIEEEIRARITAPSLVAEKGK